MKKTKFTEEQIAFALRQAETGHMSVKYAGRWVSRWQPFTTGRRNTGSTPIHRTLS